MISTTTYVYITRSTQPTTSDARFEHCHDHNYVYGAKESIHGSNAAALRRTAAVIIRFHCMLVCFGSVKIKTPLSASNSDGGWWFSYWSAPPTAPAVDGIALTEGK